MSGRTSTEPQSSELKDLKNFFLLCYLTVEVAPKPLRLLFKSRWEAQSSLAWEHPESLSKLSLSATKQKRLNEKQKEKVKRGILADWDLTLLCIVLLDSEPPLLDNSWLKNFTCNKEECATKCKDWQHWPEKCEHRSVWELRELRNGTFGHMSSAFVHGSDDRVEEWRKAIEKFCKQTGVECPDLSTFESTINLKTIGRVTLQLQSECAQSLDDSETEAKLRCLEVMYNFLHTIVQVADSSSRDLPQAHQDVVDYERDPMELFVKEVRKALDDFLCSSSVFDRPEIRQKFDTFSSLLDRAEICTKSFRYLLLNNTHLGEALQDHLRVAATKWTSAPALLPAQYGNGLDGEQPERDDVRSDAETPRCGLIAVHVDWNDPSACRNDLAEMLRSMHSKGAFTPSVLALAAAALVAANKSTDEQRFIITNFTTRGVMYMRYKALCAEKLFKLIDERIRGGTLHIKEASPHVKRVRVRGSVLMLDGFMRQLLQHPSQQEYLPLWGELVADLSNGVLKFDEFRMGVDTFLGSLMADGVQIIEAVKTFSYVMFLRTTALMGHLIHAFLLLDTKTAVPVADAAMGQLAGTVTKAAFSFAGLQQVWQRQQRADPMEDEGKTVEFLARLRVIAAAVEALAAHCKVQDLRLFPEARQRVDAWLSGGEGLTGRVHPSRSVSLNDSALAASFMAHCKMMDSGRGTDDSDPCEFNDQMEVSYEDMSLEQDHLPKYEVRKLYSDSKLSSRGIAASRVENASDPKTQEQQVRNSLESDRSSLSVQNSSSIAFSSLSDESCLKISLPPLSVGRDVDVKLLSTRDFIVTDTKLGQGGHADVFKGSYRRQDAVIVVAIKRFRMQKDPECLRREVECMKKFANNVNVVRILGYCEEPASLILEYCPLNSLLHVLDRGDSHTLAFMNWPVKLAFLSGAANALWHLHAEGIVHSDVKPENFLVQKCNKDYVAKLSDLGSASLENENEAIGTARYMAPELSLSVLKGERPKPSKKADVFSFALVMWHVASEYDEVSDNLAEKTRKFRLDPWTYGKDADETIRHAVINKVRPIIWKPCAGQLWYYQLVEQCWDQDPDNRPDFGAIVVALQQQQCQDDSGLTLASRQLTAPSGIVSAMKRLQPPCRWQQTTLEAFYKKWKKDDDAFKVPHYVLNCKQPLTREEIRVKNEVIAHIQQSGHPTFRGNPPYINGTLLQEGEGGLWMLETVTILNDSDRFYSFLHRCLELGRRADRDHGWNRKENAFRAGWRDGSGSAFTPQSQAAKEDFERRSEVMEWLRAHRCMSFPPSMLESWPELKWVSIFTCFHTCKSEATAKNICAQGFAPLCTTDEGLFGHGNYFSMDLEYSAGTYGNTEEGTATVIVCDVVVGNVYPVIEGTLKGAPGMGTYDAYFVAVTWDKGPVPCRPSATDVTVYSELVVFEAIQVLPRCILQIRRK